MRFPISQWWRTGLDSHSAVLAYFGKPFSWIIEATAAGSSVLIHCLAGAHRAGTTGVAFMMYAGGLDRATALPLAQRLRSIIDPIGVLGEVLDKYDHALAALRRGEVPAPASHAPLLGAHSEARAAGSAPVTRESKDSSSSC